MIHLKNNKNKLRESDLLYPDKNSRLIHENLIKKNWKNHNNAKLFKTAGTRFQKKITNSSRDFSWNHINASHLLKRTLIGSSIQQINSIENLGLEDSIEQILQNQELPEPPSDWVYENIPNWDSLSSQERTEIIQTYHNRMRTLQKWWATRLINDSINLTEVMTLFWHNYFASAYSKVFYPQAMYQQNNIFRTYCMGNFKDLIRHVTFGPAMMIWLDISGSRKQAPNENFARELMELFTLGVDNYTQSDVVAASRAFTGYVTNGLDTNYDFESFEGWGTWWTSWHDFDDKTFLGCTGPWTGDDIINIILEQDECAIHISKKIYKWFVYDIPDLDFINGMADVLRSNDYEIKPVLQYLFTSEYFYDPIFIGSNIQNPIQLYLGSLKRFQMESQPFDDNFFTEIQSHLNMILFEPPDVNGWLGYRSWINSNTLPLRKAMLCAFIDHTSPFGSFGNYINIPSIAESFINEDDDTLPIIQIIDNLSFLLLGVPINEMSKEQLLMIALDGAEPYDWDLNLPAHNAQWNRFEDLLRYIIRLPEFQLS